MNPLVLASEEYLAWLASHGYAKTTVAGRAGLEQRLDERGLVERALAMPDGERAVMRDGAAVEQHACGDQGRDLAKLVLKLIGEAVGEAAGGAS